MTRPGDGSTFAVRPASRPPSRAVARMRGAVVGKLRLAALAVSTVGAAVGCGHRTCGPEPVYRTEWRVVNRTENTDTSLHIAEPPHGDVRYDHLGEYWVLKTVADGRGEHRGFEELMECWRGWDEANIAFEVLAADGTPLARWRYAERDGEGRQFFDPASWKCTTERSSRDVVSVWTFEILPEDIPAAGSAPEDARAGE